MRTDSMASSSQSRSLNHCSFLSGERAARPEISNDTNVSHDTILTDCDVIDLAIVHQGEILLSHKQASMRSDSDNRRGWFLVEIERAVSDIRQVLLDVVENLKDIRNEWCLLLRERLGRGYEYLMLL